MHTLFFIYCIIYETDKNSNSLEKEISLQTEIKDSFNTKGTVEEQKQQQIFDNLTTYQAINDFSDYKIIGEIFNEFIILEKDDVMLLLDFHAGHERLLYDQMINQMADKAIVVQDLLIPYVHTVSPKEMEHIFSFKQDLEKLGFTIDQFSNKEIKISAVPLLVKDINLKEFVDSLLNDMNNFKPKISYGIDSYLMKKACRSAVKAGQKLNEMQIKHLLKNLDIKNPVLLCPHGRPIVSIVTKSQVEKWFKRIV